jgi:hypothetical protein
MSYIRSARLNRRGQISMITTDRIVVVAVAAALFMAGVSAMAQNCTRTDTDVTCDDGRTGKYAGDAIIWPDGTRSSASPHASVIIGHRPSVQVGPGVFVGKGNERVPLDNPNGRFKQQCAQLEGVSYCY